MSHENPLSLFVRRLVLAALSVLSLFALSTGVYYWLGVRAGYEASLLDCAYMTLITLTTIGYGEIMPYATLPEVRLFTIFVIIFGIGTFLYFISAATSFIFDGQLRAYLQRKSMDRQIAKLEGHIIVCGLGQTGLHTCEELVKTQHAVVGIDRSPERVKLIDDLLDNKVFTLTGDATEDALLEEAGIRRAHGLMASLPDDRDNLFCTITARTLNPNIKIVTRAVDKKSAEKIAKAGADRVVSTHFIGAMRMVSEMIRPQVVRFLDVMLQRSDDVVRIEEVRLGAEASAVGKTIHEAVTAPYPQLLVLAAYKPGGQSYQHNPSPDVTLEAGIVLVVMGGVEAVQRLRKEFRHLPV